ncbi:hypothetical protein IFR04_000930 [Cadophora malorum]|uniref:Apple domain-containing protein n=1 Tax=Cadophora malorum TaxID=108018 RepID=A0A8H7WJQ5_9HELO|nr:hypothetical protein IFR04_000930 [Cadophora malorum]
MLFTKIAVVLALLDFTVATTCTVFSFGGGNGGDIYGGAQSVSDCSNFCQQDQACVTGCLDLIMAGQCNAVGGSACDDETGTGTGASEDPSDGLIKLRKRNTFNKRATLTCSSAETCYQYTDDSLLCVNLSDGSYHDDVGGNGSLKDGTYTSPSRVVQTGTGTPSDVATEAATTTTSRAGTAIGYSPANATTGTTATRTSDAGSTASGSTATPTSDAAAAATSSNAAEKIRAGGVTLGALGLAVGLLL